MSATPVGLTLAEAYQAMTGLETVQYGTHFMVNNSGTWAEASKSILYNVIKNGGAKAVGSVSRISPSASIYLGRGVEYSAILGDYVPTGLYSSPLTQEVLFKVPTQMGGNALATPAQLSNTMRAALQNSGAEISSTALQPITKMEIVQSSGQTAIKTTAKGILTKVPFEAIMRASAVAQGIMLGIDIVETNPQLVTKIYNKMAGTDIDPELIADIVENTTVWANIRDGAVFIAEDVVQAIKDVFWEEGVFSGNQGLTGFEYGNGTIPIDTTDWTQVQKAEGSTSSSGIVSNSGLAMTKASKTSIKAKKQSDSQRFVYVKTDNGWKTETSGTISWGPSFYLYSDMQYTYKVKDVIGTTIDSLDYPTESEVNSASTQTFKPSNTLAPAIPAVPSGGSWQTTTPSTRNNITILPYNFPVIEGTSRYGRDEATRYFDTGEGTIVNPLSPEVEGTTKIPGSIFPSTPGPISKDYPAWYDSGVDTLADIDDQGNISNTRWVPVNIFDPQTQPEAQDGTTSDDDKRKAIVNTVDDSLEDNLQNDPQTEPKPQTYPEPNPEPGTDLQRVNPNPPSIDNSDGESPDPTSPILTTAITSGLAYIYNPTLTETKALGRVLWTANFVENLKKIFVNPMDGIIGFHILYAKPKTKAPEEIVLGYYGTGVNSKVVTNQYVTIDCGRIGIDEVFNDARDYDPYTTAALYLPFIGIVDLKANDVVNSYVNIKYNVDVLTGTCIAFVEVAKKGAEGTLYQFVGNCAVQLPITSGNYTAVITSLLSVASSAVGGAMIGGVPGALFGGFKGAAINATRAKMSVVQSGNLGANAGAMGIRKPFIIIRRPVTKDAYAYNKQYGYPAFKWTMLGNMHGFTRVKAVHIDFVECTDEEEQMIIEALKEGVQL